MDEMIKVIKIIFTKSLLYQPPPFLVNMSSPIPHQPPSLTLPPHGGREVKTLYSGLFVFQKINYFFDNIIYVAFHISIAKSYYHDTQLVQDSGSFDVILYLGKVIMYLAIHFYCYHRFITKKIDDEFINGMLPAKTASG